MAKHPSLPEGIWRLAISAIRNRADHKKRRFRCQRCVSHAVQLKQAVTAGLTEAAAAHTVNHMVKYQDTALDHTFAALADPTRRALLAQLELREHVSVSELARPFPVSLPAIMKHLDVLSHAGLITRTKTGRTVSCQLAAAPMQEAVGWLNRYQRFWSERLDRLAAFLEEDESCQSNLPSPRGPASPSNVVSMRRRKKSTRRGPSPKKS
jgi:DNA-binding transcriptional ArsR family regulator